MLLQLDLLRYRSSLDLRTRAGKRYVFGAIRRREFVLTPEEIVRQLLIHYLVDERGYPLPRLAAEKLVRVNGMPKRCDLLAFDANTLPYLLVECKRAEVELTDAVFAQIARYNLPLRVPYLLVTNGRQSYCCAMDYEAERYTFLDIIPPIDAVRQS